jgi:hypothetical protein
MSATVLILAVSALQQPCQTSMTRLARGRGQPWGGGLTIGAGRIRRCKRRVKIASIEVLSYRCTSSPRHLSDPGSIPEFLQEFRVHYHFLFP